jgi:ribosomal protein S18 acetylase RimI-like enzyme
MEIRCLGADEVQAHVDGLAAVLEDCVAGGASVSYLDPFTLDDARTACAGFAADAAAGKRLILAAFDGGRIVGTVQVVSALQPNQPHRADIAKLLVHRGARRQGLAEQLMSAA